MVSQDSPPNQINPHRRFPLSHPIQTQNRFENPRFDPYQTDSRAVTSYPSCIQSLGERISRCIDLSHAPPLSEESPIITQNRHLLDLFGESNNKNPSNSTDFGFGFATSSMNRAFSIFHSAYLRPTQSLLEEVVSVGGKEIDSSNERFVKKLCRNAGRGSVFLRSEFKAELCNNGLLAEKHELSAKVAKLIGLLEEVETRFDQYYRRIEELVLAFEEIAGLGAGKSYTALALQAMSRYFCTLRDIIVSQIILTRKEISQDMLRARLDSSNFNLFDTEKTQNRVSLQQLGMVFQTPRQTWRPIRGLPETSVMILRSWLFEHFLHPYPNDSEKLILTSKTGLTKNQVSNWFINARVRLWKPMIEEMYKEEFADSSDESNPL